MLIILRNESIALLPNHSSHFRLIGIARNVALNHTKSLMTKLQAIRDHFHKTAQFFVNHQNKAVHKKAYYGVKVTRS